MKWLASLLRPEKTADAPAEKPRDIPSLKEPQPVPPANQATCACCLHEIAQHSAHQKNCPHCNSDSPTRLMMAVVRYSTRLMTFPGQAVLLVETPDAITRQLTGIDGLKTITETFQNMTHSEKVDALDTIEAAIISRYITGMPEECDVIHNIYGILRGGGWLLMRGNSTYFAEQAGFTVYENTISRVAMMPKDVANGIESAEKVYFCMKQSNAGRATNTSDKERAELRASFDRH